MAKIIDLTLKDLNIAGLDNYINDIGTKKPSGQGLSTEEITDNDLLSYKLQRAVIANENLDATGLNTDGSAKTVDSDRKIVFTSGGLYVKVPKASYAGCCLTILADFENSTSELRYESADGVFSTVTINANEVKTLYSNINGYFKEFSNSLAVGQGE